MIEALLQYLAPHHCCGCDNVGSLLCDDCKYNIITDKESYCLVCRCPTVDNWLCSSCKVPYDRAWSVGERSGSLQRLVGLYKFERAVEAHRPLASLLDETLPILPSDTVLVPVPTAPSRIRERGYDHMLLIAKLLAKKRSLRCEQLIMRKANTKQRQSSAKQRKTQAKQAFIVEKLIDSNVPYLIIDDVMTTGATAEYAAKVLRETGAKHVWLAIIARQTLD